MGRPLLDLSLYLVTDTALCGQFGVAATVSAAVGAGVTVVQLRDEHATDDELVSLGRKILAVLDGTDVPLIVNDRVHLVDAIGAHGGHVGQSDLQIGQARALLGPAAYLGLSAQTVEHVATAREHADGTVDYLGVGPVWGTATKLDAAAPGGLERLHQVTSASPWPCVAIGGINRQRLPRVRRAGAAGAAVVSAICGQPDVAAATRALRAAWDEASR
ncbi:MAG TPA: thiamine phosphate synthase [Dermatophilaceae bacterium]|nr:thiamine phosphate synthase [Dermatophilaceae bacterium]